MTKKRKKPRNLRLLVQRDLESKGWTVGVVERQTGPVKRDLFGVADLFAFDRDSVSLIQVTTTEKASGHQKTIEAWPLLRWWTNGYGIRNMILALVDKDNIIEYRHF